MIRDLAGLVVGLAAVEVVAAMEFVVKVAEDGAVDGDASALESVGLDMATEIGLHDVSPLGCPPPGGYPC